MSAAIREKDEVMFCASCGTAAGDGIKLKRCTACYLVRYCSVKCQKEHRPKHKKECKRRAAELRDEILFKQPEGSHLGDCPICCVPLPIDPSKSTLMTCCSKRLCYGCCYANGKREREGGLQYKCAFCRKVLIDTKEEINYEELMKRIEVNDPVAMCFMGTTKYVEGNYKSACEYWTRAAALGDVEAHFQVSTLYREGKGVEKNEKLTLHHAEKAAIGGSAHARHNLGCTEWKNGRFDRAVKHYIIAAKQGYDPSLECVKECHQDGHASREDLAAAIRGHKAAVDATKSPQREEFAELLVRRAAEL